MTANSTGSSDRTLSSLALLQVNWDVSRLSHLDNFVPFALETMRRRPADQYTAAEIQTAIHDEFGFSIPVAVVGTVLRRARLADHGTLTPGGLFQPSQSVFEDMPGLHEQELRCQREQRNLAESLAAHALSEFGASWNTDAATAALHGYVEINASVLLGTALKGRPTSGRQDDSADQVVVASWVAGIVDNDPERFDFLITVVKGTMLASSLLVPVGIEAQRQFDNTRVVVDTPVVLKALGYEGEEAEVAARETLALARHQGARLVCFDKTIGEARGVLQSAAASLIRGSTDANRAVDQYFSAAGYSHSDVLRRAEKVDIDLGRLGVEVRGRPEHVDYLTVDEKALDDLLAMEVHYGSRRAGLLHDLDALTAVHRLRGMNEGDRLETCRAVLVTTNGSVVKVAQTFPGFAGHSWPIAMRLNDLATMLWVKQPVQAPDLPRHQFLAACVAVLSPNNLLWRRYLEEVDRLRGQAEITDDDAALLRYSQEAQRALMRETLGRSDDVAPATVHAVLDRVQDAIRSPIQGQLMLEQARAAQDRSEDGSRIDELSHDIEDARRSAQAATERADTLQAREDAVRASAVVRGARAGRLATWAVTAILVVGALGSLTQSQSLWPIRIVLVIALIYGNLTGPGRHLGGVFGRWITNRRLKALDLQK